MVSKNREGVYTIFLYNEEYSYAVGDNKIEET